MGEEFYSVLKLTTGEEIFSLISIDENDGDPIVLLQNPVIIKTINTLNGSFIKVKPWMEIPDDDFFIIKPDNIVTMTEVNDSSMIDIYNNYLEDSDETLSENFNDNNQTKITDKMGYISSVEEARKNLEKIFKGIKES
jgi:hypothetical protein